MASGLFLFSPFLSCLLIYWWSQYISKCLIFLKKLKFICLLHCLGKNASAGNSSEFPRNSILLNDICILFMSFKLMTYLDGPLLCQWVGPHLLHQQQLPKKRPWEFFGDQTFEKNCWKKYKQFFQGMLPFQKPSAVTIKILRLFWPEQIV